jgi:hypothetical protein
LKAHCSHLEPSTRTSARAHGGKKKRSLGWREEKGEKRKKKKGKKKEKKKEGKKIGTNELFGFLEIVFCNLYWLYYYRMIKRESGSYIK